LNRLGDLIVILPKIHSPKKIKADVDKTLTEDYMKNT
jgi:hypothetical protein